MFALIEGLVALGIVALIVCVTYAVAGAADQGRRAPVATGVWQAAHYGAPGSTRVVVRKVVPGTGAVLDERRIDVIADEDPDWDARFLDAMARARDRAALLQSEE